MNTNTRWLLINTGLPLPPLRSRGTFSQWIASAAGLSAEQCSVVNVFEGEALPAVDAHAGVIVSGSPAMVTERLDWSERCADWLAKAHQKAVPMLGICYGHQLLAHALGGTVADNPKGREMGTVTVHLSEAASADPLLAGTPKQFDAHVSHLQTVLQPPPDAVVLGHSAQDDCQMFRLGRTVGFQFHPEFDADITRTYVQERAEALRACGQNPNEIRANVRDVSHPTRLLRRFIELATS